jgi:plasmid stability protein
MKAVQNPRTRATSKPAKPRRHNLHLPLKDELHARLRLEATRIGASATSVARRALDEWLRARERIATQAALRRYVQQVAGTEDDLDVELEAATIRLLADSPE